MSILDADPDHAHRALVDAQRSLVKEEADREQEARVTAWIRDTVAAAPPLTAEQLDRIRTLLKPVE